MDKNHARFESLLSEGERVCGEWLMESKVPSGAAKQKALLTSLANSSVPRRWMANIWRTFQAANPSTTGYLDHLIERRDTPASRVKLFRNHNLPGSERGDVAEALDEVFLNDGSISLQEAKTIGSGTALDGDALDIRAVADGDEREAVGGRELHALRPEYGLERDFVMFAGERVFIHAKAE